MRPLAMRIPSAFRSDVAKRSAHTFSQIISAHELLSSSASPMSSTSSMPSSLVPCDAEDGQGGSLLGDRIGQLDRVDVAVGILVDDHEVEDLDGPVVDELLECRDDLPRELVAREGDGDVFDRSDRHG